MGRSEQVKNSERVAPDRVVQRFLAYMPTGVVGGCWEWPKSIGNHGYGQIGWSDGDGTRMVLTHRLAWHIANGPIPEGLTIDHLCRNRRCCNPGHMRLLTNAENGRLNGAAVKTHCVHGHAFSPENTQLTREGHRRCVTCQTERNRRRFV